MDYVWKSWYNVVSYVEEMPLSESSYCGITIISGVE